MRVVRYNVRTWPVIFYYIRKLHAETALRSVWMYKMKLKQFQIIESDILNEFYICPLKHLWLSHSFHCFLQSVLFTSNFLFLKA